MLAIPSSSCGCKPHNMPKEKKIVLRGLFSSLFCFLLFVLFVTSGYAQQRITADVTTRQVMKNKSLRVERQLFYTAGGNLVIHYTYPQEYYLTTNGLGEVTVYSPKNNEVTMFRDNTVSSQSETMISFISPDHANLGLRQMGFVQKKSEKEGKRIVKTFIPTLKEDKIYSKVVVVSEQGEPIYCAFYDKNNNIVRKTYYAEYVRLPMVSFPTRITQISYGNVGDSIVRQEVYKNIKTSGFASSEMFDFKVPANAKRVNPFETKK